MIREEITNLFNLDKESPAYNEIENEKLYELDSSIINSIDEENFTSEILGIYRKFQPMKQDTPQSMKSDLLNTLRNLANTQLEENKNIESLIIYRFLVVKSNLMPQDYINIAINLSKINYKDLADYFANLYDKKETNRPLAYLVLADLYKNLIKEYTKAITYYEKFIEINSTKASVYNILADLYSKAYADEKLEEQIKYYKKALELSPDNRLAMHGLAFCYEKLEYYDEAKKYYELLIHNNPSKTDFYNYGLFLIHSGNFVLGHKYIKNRFELDNINLEYPSDKNKKWDFETNITDKTLLVHYEQGFGDTIMYCRFLPQLKKFAKKIIFVVQKELHDLIKNSPIISDGIELQTSENNIEYDYNMALLDIPYALKTTIDTITHTNKYLQIDNKKIQDYKEKYINNNPKIKIGIAYSGDKKANYSNRDIDINKFNSILNLPNTEFYYLQKEQITDNRLINLGKYFHDFSDTACAICNMDMVISTDNVILNLAGALGVKTIGLLNKNTNYRWFKTKGENIGWYNSVKPLQAKVQNDWDEVFLDLINEIKNLSN